MMIYLQVTYLMNHVTCHVIKMAMNSLCDALELFFANSTPPHPSELSM